MPHQWSRTAGGAQVWCEGDALPRRAITVVGEGAAARESVACACLNATHYVTGAQRVELYDGCDALATRCRTAPPGGSGAPAA